MNKTQRTLAATEILLVCPAVLFMTSLFVRNLQPVQYEPAQTAQRLVGWFSARPLLGLDVFLIALPLAALVLGCVTVLRAWQGDAELRQAALRTLVAVRAHLATLLVAGATLAAGGILAIVALHVITD
jgi:anti-sigma factor RsiW